ncbi:MULTISPECIES: helix-turn-helix domain-containing protein [Lacticaseibacillus]|uniref:Transcriptional regulator n=1 Tax=Lacticaseibacillus casei DSM 20011 = JCM 1134 = ATCC 393 TaxID=1423732 RepID=A0AAD1ET35_LACCA|nr:helix-turn-helix transcriptional regulator [Lacticaseibacillus casei]MBI6598722.1 helix-turn-helix transcriptional regulator [Lacticaseibacillus casei]MBO1482386.1 helix-turn-helix transcriptional regulator [Lacticaseibacillus casei]MBO2417630.1 helix-turn-helix transcriptional regulator [Lacticaseibacillus casei]MCK2082043.1 helix-turn-helix transcriptional regulator [Lacticaseibacillus casei]MDZ5494953.1 helix-turn-helix transcriptional regulator [Lacticaseibacillus casei]
MQLSQIIRNKRLAAGLTQEELAQKVGVSAPAVSKWEKGTSYPDITLLPVLARNLGTDINKLLDFSSDLDPAALQDFFTKLTMTAQKDGWQAAVALVDQELRDYPSVSQLQMMAAPFLDTLKPQIPKDDWPPVQQRIIKLYEAAEQSSDLQQAQLAALGLFNFYLSEEQFDAAEKQLAALPTETVTAWALKPKLQLKRGQLAEAYVEGEKLLGCDYGALGQVLGLLTQVAIADHQLATAEEYVKVAKALDQALHMNSPFVIETELQLAEATKDAKRAVAVIRQFADNLDQPFPKVFQHLPQPKPRESPAVARKQFVQNVVLDPDLAFLQDTPEYNELLKQYAD